MLYVYVIICVDIRTYFRTMFIATSHRPHHGPFFRFHVEIHGLSPRYSANHHGTSVRKYGHVRYGNPCIFEVPKWSKWIQMGWERHGNLYVSWCFMMLPLLKFHSHRQPWMKLWANWKQTLSVGTSYTKTHGSVVFRLPAWIAKAWLIFEWCPWLNLSKP